MSPVVPGKARPLARALVELLQLQAENLFVEIVDCGDSCLPQILTPGLLRWEAVLAGPATVLARIPAIPGVRTVSMNPLEFSAFPAGWDKILLSHALRDAKQSASQLWNLAKHLRPGGRLIVAEAVPCPELPLALGLLRRWHPDTPTAVQIADWLRAAGLQVELLRVVEPTRWSVPECEQRIRERAQLAPELCGPRQLAQALDELHGLGACGELAFDQPIDLIVARA